MSWSTYAAFVLVCVVLILIPGPDFAVVVRCVMADGRRSGQWCAAGVAGAAAIQGLAAACGLGALVVASRPVYTALTWAGAAYLCWLGIQALRSAWRGYADPEPTNAPTPDAAPGAARDLARRTAYRGLRVGFVSNITNPKVVTFYLAVLPQFLTPEATVGQAVTLALTHAVLSLGYLVALAAGVQAISAVVRRARVRRAVDAGTGLLLVGLAGRLALPA